MAANSYFSFSKERSNDNFSKNTFIFEQDKEGQKEDKKFNICKELLKEKNLKSITPKKRN